MKVENMKSERTGKAVANQFVITDNEHNATWFQSYASMIARIDNNSDVLFLDKDKWAYSRTTAKYRNAFIRDYFASSYASAAGIAAGIKEGKIIMKDLNH